MATKKPDNPWLSLEEVVKRYGFDEEVRADPIVSDPSVLDLRKRPDGVWELPK